MRRHLIGVPLVAGLVSVVVMFSLTPAAQAASALPSPAQSLFVNTLTSVPVYGPANPAAGALDQFEQFNEGSAFGLMLAVATVSLWGYWAGGLLLSGSGGTEVVESVIKIALSGFAIVMWPVLFKDAIEIVNALCSSIVHAPFAHAPMQRLAIKLGSDTALTAKAGVAMAAQMGGKLDPALVGGISIASFVATGDPFAWILDFIVTLLFMVGQLIIEIERLALFATTTFIYVAGPLAIALWAFRGLTPTISAFFRIAQSVLLIILVWTIFLVLFAIMDSAVAPVVWNLDPKAWFASIGDHLTSLVLLWMLVFTPGIVRRHVGAGGAGATGVLRTAALLGGYRMFRGGGRGATRAPKAKYTGSFSPTARGAGQLPSTPGRTAGPKPSTPGRSAGPPPSTSGRNAGAKPSVSGRNAGAPPSTTRRKAGKQPSPNGRNAGPQPSTDGRNAGQQPATKGRKAGPQPSTDGRNAGQQPWTNGRKAGPQPSTPGRNGGQPSSSPSRGAGPPPSNPSRGAGQPPSNPSHGAGPPPSGPSHGAGQAPSNPSRETGPPPSMPRPSQAGPQPSVGPPSKPPQPGSPQPGGAT